MGKNKKVEKKRGFLQIGDTYKEKYLKKIPDAGENPAYTHKDKKWSGIVFIEIRKCVDKETGEPCAIYTIINEEDFEEIKEWRWSDKGGYFVNGKGGFQKYLHHMACKGFTEEEAKNGKIVHHKGHKFDNRSEMLEVTTRLEHDQKRTYYGTMIVGINKDSGETETRYEEEEDFIQRRISNGRKYLCE